MKRIIRLVHHPLISGSSIIFAGSLLANIFNYIFNLAMGRILLPAEYGLLTSLISLTVLFAIFQASMTNVFAKYSARFFALKDSIGVSSLIKVGIRFDLILTSAILVLLVLSTGFIARFFHVTDTTLLFLIYGYIGASIMSSLPNGIFQGEVRVFIYSFLIIFGSLLKIIIGVVLVLMGLKVFGAIVGVTIAGIIPCILAYVIILRALRKQEAKKVSEADFIHDEFQGHALHFFLATLGITLFTSVDTILARHFFTPIMAGQYAALSLMGKAIFYLTFPIYFVFFPLVAQRKEKKEKVFSLLMLGTGMVVAVSAFASVVYFAFPDVVLKIFFPKPEYKLLAPYLGPFSIFILIFSLANLLSNFLLSIGKNKVSLINMFCGVLLIVAISTFHATIYQVIASLAGISFLLLILLLIYYAYYGRD